VSLTASAAYTDAQFVSFANSPQAPERTNEGAIQDLSGQRLPGVSKFAYSLAVDAARPLSDDLELYGHADWMHRSSFNSTPTNSIYGVVPGYGLLNARIGLRTGGGAIDLSVWARNLLDKDYYVSRGGGTFGLITAMIGEPRTIGATLRTRW
jgi:iron complex outermembrane receptor protein